MKYKHNEKFYRQRYKEIINFTKEKGIANPYKNINDFIFDYNDIQASGSKRVMYDLKYSLQYDTSREVARAEMRVLKELKLDKGVKIRDLKKMSTIEFASIYQDKIEDQYWSMRSQGLSSVQAKAFISNYWFGSK